MNELKVFDERDVLGKAFRIYGTPDEPLFLAKDVASWIEYDVSSVNKMLNNIDSEEKVRKIVPTLGGSQEMWLLTEDGLYEVLMQSRKPIAKAFKKEVKKILKAIRKTGGYIPATPEMSESEIMALAIRISMRTINEQKTLIQQQQKQLDDQAHKVAFADSVSASNSMISVFDLAKILRQNGANTGGNRLFEWLRQHGYLVNRKGSSWNMPTQYSIDRGLFAVVETIITHSDGYETIRRTPKVTGKGQVYFINKFLQAENLQIEI